MARGCGEVHGGWLARAHGAETNPWLPHMKPPCRKLISALLHKEAEKRLEAVPKAQWQKQRISKPGWGEDIDVRWRDVLELAMVALRSPECDHTKLVWGPELECDHDTDEFGYMADLCIGPW